MDNMDSGTMDSPKHINPVYDVLIVGAGPVGLATAIALHQRGITNILVIDQTRKFRPVGQTVDILPNGLKALKVIDQQAYEQVKTIGLEFTQNRRKKSESDQQTTPKKRYWYQKDLQGNIIRSIPLDFDYWLERYAAGRVSIPWHSLQSTLRELLPADKIKANHRCVNLTFNTASITVETISDQQILDNPFAHWQRKSATPASESSQVHSTQPNHGQKYLEAKLVVAADGINSTIRNILYADSPLRQWSMPKYSGYAAIGCLHITQVCDQIIQEVDSKYFKSQAVVTLRNPAVQPQHTAMESTMDAPRLMLVRRDQNSLGYLLHLPLSLDLLTNNSPASLVELAITRLKETGFSPVLCQIVKLSHLSQLIRRPYYIHPANPANIDPHQSIWSCGRVVLVGDAAHGMPPFTAQGANQGLEDAAVIGVAIEQIITDHNLDNLATISAQFSQYEQLRRPFMAQVQAAAMHSHNWSQAEWEQYSDMVYNRNLADLISTNYCSI